MHKRLSTVITILVLIAVCIISIFGIHRLVYNKKAKHIYQQAERLFKQKDYESALKAYEKLTDEFSKSAFIVNAQIGLAESYLGLGKLLQARDIYKKIPSGNLDLNRSKSIYNKLGDLNIKLLFSPIKTQDSIIYKVQDKDILETIAKRFNTTVALIKKANNIASEIIVPGRDLKVTTARFGIVVDKSQNSLTLKSGEEIVKVYLVSTALNNSTPVGTFKIINKIVDPPWFSGGKAIPPGDPKNILGSRWMGLTLKSYGIHGTTDDISIGKQCTQGCVRMHNYEVEELYTIVPLGTEVVVVD